jgi:HSP20 family protein
MAEQNVQTKNRKEESGSQSGVLQRRPTSGGILRRDPFWSSSEFLAASPFSVMRRFAEEMDRAFSGWGPDAGSEGRGLWSPEVDITERDGKMVVTADLPGLKKDDVKVEVMENSLIIQGERRQEHEESDRGYRRSERRYGSFYRSIPLPEGAQTDQARAEFKDGVLEVSMPVPTSQQRRGRQVPIETGGSTERKQLGTESSAQNRESKAG